GVRNLIARGVLFDALQGGAPPQTRLAAIAALGRISAGGKEPAAFKELLQMLKDPDTESAEKKTHPVRDSAVATVAKVGAAYPDLLVPAANDPDANIKAQSQAALKVIGAPLQTAMAAKLGDSGLRAPLGDILSTIGPQTIPLIAPYLKAPLLKDEDSAAKIQLIEVMGKFKTAEAATAILPFAKDTDPNVRRSVVTSLANIGDPAGAPVLIAALKNMGADASARAAAAGALGAIATPEANAAMGTALTDYDLSVASSAGAGLRRAGDAAQTVIAQALLSTNPYVRTRAAEAAGGLSVPALAERALASDKDPDVRVAAARSVGDVLIAQKNASPAALAPLLEALSDPNGSVADAAADQLGRIGLPAVAPLTTRLASGNDTVAYYASQALGGVGKPAVDGLLILAQPGKPAARWAAITLGDIGDARATPQLRALAASPDADTAYAATAALAKVRPG
ncbi:MAG: HEAT repeat domain-containing protein, partial [Cytophagales bacterium]|nr:HEAT repeat domain-containing protein [Armatimonadota bacterium]